MRITVTIDGGETLDLDLRVGDVRRFENAYGCTLADLVVEEGKSAPAGHLDKMLFLAWCAAKRTKQTELPFDDWCDTIVGVGAVEPDPLDQPTGESPSS